MSNTDNTKSENFLYPMDRELVRKTQINNSFNRIPKDIPRVTTEERAYLRASLNRCAVA